VPSISIDYALMEKCRHLEVVAADFEWDDLGSWDAVARHTAPDAAGNLLHPRHVAVDAEDCFVRAEDGTTVALLGVSDLVVVRTKDALLVARRGRGEDVRRVYEALQARGREDLLR
jgi:mannose-1-phosphate guanylyltransferase